MRGDFLMNNTEISESMTIKLDKELPEYPKFDDVD